MSKTTQVAVPNSFAFGLLDQEIAAHNAGNVVISPASVAVALGMTLNGSRAATRAGMLKALGFKAGSSLKEINTAFAALLAEFGKAGSEVELKVANALWTKRGLTIKPAFLKANAAHFGASVEALDFSQAAALDRMNGWVDENTKGKIKKIVDKIEDPELVVMFLMNAVYFKGSWTTEFNKILTQSEPFYKTDGTDFEHPLMHRKGSFDYFEHSEFQAVKLPYGKGGGRFGMYVFLPTQNGKAGVREFVRHLQRAPFDTWMQSFRRKEGEVFLPRFKLEYDSILNTSLAKMGMPEAFDDEGADFSGMVKTPPRRKIDKVQHKTFIDVNEEGTEAAAVTSVGMVTVTSIRMPETPFVLRADRPFYFFIRDDQTGAVLFAGVIHDPRK